MFLESLELKARLALDTDFVEYRWPNAGSDFNYDKMECIDPRQSVDGRRITIALLPAIIAPDRRELVLSKSIVVL